MNLLVSAVNSLQIFVNQSYRFNIFPIVKTQQN